MTSLRGRVLATFLVLGVATLLGVGAALFVVLRGLHQEASSAALGDVAAQLVAVARLRAGNQAVPPRRLLAVLRENPLPAGTALLVVDQTGSVIGRIGGGGEGARFPAQIALTPGGARGEIERGAFEVPGDGRYVYVAATFTGPRAAQGPRALVLARPDDSGERALGDLTRALGTAALVLLLVGGPLAVWLASSVTRPLARLAAATGSLRRGQLPGPLPVDGPAEVAEASGSFNAMVEEVAASRRAQAELVTNLRHDLRTPLTVIGGFAQALIDRTARGREAARAANAIAAETARLERLVDNLGDLADLDTGARRLRVEQLDAGELVRETAARFAPLAEANGQHLAAAPPNGRLQIAADRTAVERILGNLVRNALSAAPRPGGRIRLQPAALADGRIRLCVEDDGPGIPPAAVPRLFERFFRADPARAGDGSGLGLAIVEELARAHGGHAFAENLPGGGARVGVVLPAAAAPDGPRS